MSDTIIPTAVKTTLLDKIRGTSVAAGEAGGITQHIGASEIPIDNIKKICGHLVKKMGIDFRIPGLLIIDSPGHEAFTTLRKRGGSIADLAVLVIDVKEGFQPQTDESLNFLQQFKTPFVVAATKIDLLAGWRPQEDQCFLDSFQEQGDMAREHVDEAVYNIVNELAQRGIDADRFDRVQDFAKQVCVVPVSNITGEGIPDLLIILAGMAQKYLKGKLEITPGEGKGTVLEVKEFKGLGTTIDAIIYDGEVKKNDYLILGGKELINTRIRALLEPSPLRELRTEKRFQRMESVSAAAGIKIAAPGLDKAIAGMPLRSVRNEDDAQKAEEEIKKEMEEVEIETEKKGVILRADTLGSLEALIKSLKDKVPVKSAKVGTVTKKDIAQVKTIEEPIIFAFRIKVPEYIEKKAEDNQVKIFSSDVIYRLLEGYQEWKHRKSEREKKELLDSVTRPGRVKVLPGCTFRKSKPAIFGVEVVKGTVRPGYRLEKEGEIIGEIKEVQSEGENVDQAESGDRVALSIPGATAGKDFQENDILENHLTREDWKTLNKIKGMLKGKELELLREREEE